MLISLRAVATHLVITVEMLSHIELSRRLCYKLFTVVCDHSEQGSLHQLCARAASGI